MCNYKISVAQCVDCCRRKKSDKTNYISNGFNEPFSSVFGSSIYQYVTVTQTCLDMLMKMVIPSFL